MPEFRVKLVDARGRTTWCRMQAVSEPAVREAIKAQRKWLVGEPVQLHRGRTTFDTKIDNRTLLSLIDQMVLMLEASLGIQRAVESLAEQYPMGKVRFFLTQVSARLAVDADLSAAFGQFPRMFAPEMVAMMRPAQGAAQLVPLLRRLTEQLEQAGNIQATVRRATSYPLFLLGACVLVMLAAIYFLVPKFEDLLMELVAKPPLFSRMLFAGSAFVRNYMPFIIAATVGAFILVKYMSRQPFAMRYIERMLLAMPRLRDALNAIVLAQVMANIGMLYGAGVPMEEVLRQLGKSLRWPSYRLAINQTLRGVLGGGGRLSEAMKGSGKFPPMVCAMVGTGEEIGALPAIFDRLAKWYAKDAERAVSQALVFLEPVLMVIMAGFVAWLMFSFFQPLSQIYQSIGSGH